jgi:hypothetical protein
MLGLAPQPTKSHIVIPAQAGIYRQHGAWIPAFAGMTVRQ